MGRRELNRWLYRRVSPYALGLALCNCSVYDDGLLNKRRADAIATDGGPASDAAAGTQRDRGESGSSGAAGKRGGAGSPSDDDQQGAAGEKAERDASVAPAKRMERAAGAGAAGAAGAAAAGAAADGGAARDSGGAADHDAAVADVDAATAKDASAADGGGPQCVVDTVSSYCSALPALPGAPVIDGELECGLRLLPLGPEGWTGSGTPSKTASYAAAWHPDGLYLYVEVRGKAIEPHPSGQPIYCGDAVELFVDADANLDDGGAFDANGTMQLVIAAPASESGDIDAMRFIQGTPQGAWFSKSLRTRRLTNEEGYSVEALVAAPDLNLWEWTPSMRLGFSMGIDVAAVGGADGNCGGRAGVFYLRVVAPDPSCAGEPWCDVRAFCRPSLRRLPR